MAVDSGPFPQSALDTNRNGRLTDAQLRVLRADARGVRKSELSVAAVAVVFAVVILVAARPSTPALEHVGIPIACVALAIVLVVRAIIGADRLTRDLRRPRVQSLEGATSKHAVTTSGKTSSSTTHYVYVAGKSFKVGRAAYVAAPDMGIVRIFFLPISRHVVNLEQLPDRPLPEGATPQQVVQDIGAAMHAHDRVQIDEARAEMAALGHTMMPQVSHDVPPPPVEGSNPQALEAALPGTWSSGMITVSFSSNGTFTLTMMGGAQRSGNWSVDGDGELVADFGGQNQAADARISGDRLTVWMRGTAVTLTRTSS